jgi:hypothetical protein
VRIRRAADALGLNAVVDAAGEISVFHQISVCKHGLQRGNDFSLDLRIDCADFLY